jgi:hypothetical protein
VCDGHLDRCVCRDRARVLTAPLDDTIPGRLFPTVEGKGITAVELTCLHMALRNEDPDALDIETFLARATWPTVRNWDNELWVERVPPVLAEALAGLAEDEVAQVARWWMQSEQMQFDWGARDTSWVVPYVRDFAHLAQQALASRHAMFLWISV